LTKGELQLLGGGGVLGLDGHRSGLPKSTIGVDLKVR